MPFSKAPQLSRNAKLKATYCTNSHEISAKELTPNISNTSMNNYQNAMIDSSYSKSKEKFL